MSHRSKLIVSVLLLSKICQRFNEGGKPYTAVELKQATDVPVSIVRDLLHDLVEANILIEIISDKQVDDMRFQPAISIDKITVGYMVDCLESTGKWDLTEDVKCQTEKPSMASLVEIRKQYIDNLNVFELKDM